MKAPGFWWRAPGLASTLLLPAAAIYGLVAGQRMNRPGRRANIPVICVGNVTVGGAGKTPTALALAPILRELGYAPAFLTRGYGGRLRGPVAVDLSRHGPGEIGDEALLLARDAPTIVARDRPAGAGLAAAQGSSVVVMDDGLQNPSLAKDLALAVFDGAIGIGNGLPLPSGPLRADLDAQWPRIDAAVIIGPGAAGDDVAKRASRLGKPVVRAQFEVEADAARRLAGRRVLGFAGIGRPAKFFASLADCGAEVAATRAFADHHPYTLEDLRDLLGQAEAHDLALVTTEKDRARLSDLAKHEPWIDSIHVLPVSVRFDAPDRLRELLAARLGSRAAGSA